MDMSKNFQPDFEKLYIDKIKQDKKECKKCESFEKIGFGNIICKNENNHMSWFDSNTKHDCELYSEVK